MTPERIREKFEEDIERKLAETDIIQEETEFTWIWNGEVTVFFQGVSLESWELCTPDYSQIQLSWSPIYIQTIEALKTATGRIKTSPQHDVVRARLLRDDVAALFSAVMKLLVRTIPAKLSFDGALCFPRVEFV